MAARFVADYFCQIIRAGRFIERELRVVRREDRGDLLSDLLDPTGSGDGIDHDQGVVRTSRTSPWNWTGNRQFGSRIGDLSAFFLISHVCAVLLFRSGGIENLALLQGLFQR